MAPGPEPEIDLVGAGDLRPGANSALTSALGRGQREMGHLRVRGRSGGGSRPSVGARDGGGSVGGSTPVTILAAPVGADGQSQTGALLLFSGPMDGWSGARRTGRSSPAGRWLWGPIPRGEAVWECSGRRTGQLETVVAGCAWHVAAFGGNAVEKLTGRANICVPRTILSPCPS